MKGSELQLTFLILYQTQRNAKSRISNDDLYSPFNGHTK